MQTYFYDLPAAAPCPLVPAADRQPLGRVGWARSEASRLSARWRLGGRDGLVSIPGQARSQLLARWPAPPSPRLGNDACDGTAPQQCPPRVPAPHVCNRLVPLPASGRVWAMPVTTSTALTRGAAFPKRRRFSRALRKHVLFTFHNRPCPWVLFRSTQMLHPLYPHYKR